MKLVKRSGHWPDYHLLPMILPVPYIFIPFVSGPAPSSYSCAATNSHQFANMDGARSNGSTFRNILPVALILVSLQGDRDIMLQTKSTSVPYTFIKRPKYILIHVILISLAIKRLDNESTTSIMASSYGLSVLTQIFSTMHVTIAM